MDTSPDSNSSEKLILELGGTIVFLTLYVHASHKFPLIMGFLLKLWKTRMHSSRMCTALSSPQGFSKTDPPLVTETHLDRDPLGQRPPWIGTPPGQICP